MKNLLFLLVVSAFFVACSDDDDDNKGNNIPSGGEEIILLPKRISKIVEYEDGTPTTYEFKYDDEGRIDELTKNDQGDHSHLVCKYTYAADKITMKSIQGENQEETYTLQDGKTSYYKFSFTDYKGDWDFFVGHSGRKGGEYACLQNILITNILQKKKIYIILHTTVRTHPTKKSDFIGGVRCGECVRVGGPAEL